MQVHRSLMYLWSKKGLHWRQKWGTKELGFISVAPIWNCGSNRKMVILFVPEGTKLPFSFSLWRYSHNLAFKASVHFLKYLEVDPHIIFPQRSIWHYLATTKRGSRSQKARPSETQTQLCSFSLPSELLYCSDSFLNPIQRIKLVSHCI